MNHTLATVVGAVAFWWLGMIIAISFIEAPLKFRAPGITIPLGLGIGRIVFRVLNIIEAVAGVVVIVAVSAGHPTVGVLVTTVIVLVMLIVQLAAVRPMLNRRTDRVLASGDSGQRSHAHLAYVGLEAVKALGLIALGIHALAG